MKKIITTILFILVVQLCSSQAAVKVLAKGSIYNWKISEMTDNKKTAVYFTMESAVTKNSSGLYIGIMTAEELKFFVEQLRLFSNYIDSYDHYERGESFEIVLDGITKRITLSGTGYILLTKVNAKSLATDIEKSIGLLNN